MTIFKIICSITLLGAGWILIFNPGAGVAFNRFMRDAVFNDRLIVTRGRKLAVIFFCCAMVALYSAFNDITRLIGSDQMHATDHLMYMALRDYDRQKYPAAIARYEAVLRIEPANREARKRLAYALTATGDTQRAHTVWKELLRMNPQDTEVRTHVEKK